MNQAGDQRKIWEHYQTHAVESFDLAAPRLEYIADKIFKDAKLSGKEQPSVLNIGIGNGHIEEVILARGGAAASLDPDAVAVERMKTKGVIARVGLIEELPFEDGLFDYVVVSEVLEHLTDAQRTKGLKEISRVLRSGGAVVGTVPYNENLADNMAVCPHCGEVFHRWGHQKSFGVESLEKELAQVFEVRLIKRTAFISFRKRKAIQKLKGMIRLLLAKAGSQIAFPNIFFFARKAS